MLLIIADISGYTRYMTANAKTLSHSQVIITELVEAIIREVELPLEVAKLEGDAVFLFCRKHTPVHSWSETRRAVSAKLVTFFDRFSRKVQELSESTTCDCNACTHIEKLRLKVVVHSGEALFHRVFNFLELAGVDVIIVHRLLKNSVASDQYLLLTESAARELEFPQSDRLMSGVEHYDDFGPIKTLVYQPETGSPNLRSPAVAPAPEANAEASQACTSQRSRFARSWSLYWKLWFAPLGTKRRALDCGAPGGRPGAGRMAFAALTIVLTPFMLPVAAIFVWRHVARSRHAGLDATQHPANCSCERHP